MNKKVKLLIPFLALVLIFSFVLACTSDSASSNTTKNTEEAEVVENVAFEEIIEEGQVEGVPPASVRGMKSKKC